MGKEDTKESRVQSLPPLAAVRVEAVRRWGLHVVDVEGLEGILALVAHATGALAGGIGIVDERVVHVKAAFGVDFTTIPVEASIGARLLGEDGPLAVADAREHPLLWESAFVTGPPYARSVLASPLTPAYGIPVGMLVLLHPEPGRFTELDVDAARAARTLIEREILRQVLARREEPARPASPPWSGGLMDAANPPGIVPPAQARSPLPVVRSPHARLLLKKWSPRVLAALRSDPGLRFGDLMQRLHGISSRTLSDRLKEMHAAGLLEREQSATIPVRVSYRLTDAGLEVADMAAPLLELEEVVADGEAGEALNSGRER